MTNNEIMYLIVHPLFKILFRYEIQGKESIPKEGAFILAANHMSYIDPFMVGLAAYPRELNSMSKASLFRIPGLRWYLKKMNAFPVKRGIADKAAIATVIRILSEGKPLVIYPEGTRSRNGQLGPPQPGVAMIALKLGVPIVPVGIIGTDKVMPDGCKIPRLPKLKARVGEPIMVEKTNASERREKEAELTSKVMTEIGKLIAGD